jgi:hypothetical protein
MSKSKQKSPTRFKGDIYARVRQAQPIARKVLREGLDDQHSEFADLVPCDEPLSEGRTDDDVAKLVVWTDAVFVIGIAVGLLLRPEAFDKGGAR